MHLHDYVDRWAAQRPHGEFAVQGERRTTWAQARDVSAGAACGCGWPGSARATAARYWPATRSST